MITLEITKKNRFKELADQLHSNADILARETAARIVEVEQSLVPVDTGALRDSIHVERLGNASYNVIAGDLNADVDYAVYIEYGRSDSAAQPFVTPAAELTRPDFIDMASRELLS